MLCHVAHVRTDVSVERVAASLRVTLDELGITLPVSSNRSTLRRNTLVPSSPILVTLMMEATFSSETSVLRRATWRNIPEDTILHIVTHQGLA
jgi:hypothetical protein